MRRIVLLTVLAVLVGAPPASAEIATIRMPGKFFDPNRSTIVAGDLVVFRNNDIVTHDVRIGGGIFDSGPIARFSSWSQRVDQPGGYPFVCTLHPFMSGNLEVLAATLSAEPDTVLAGEPLRLSGRAPAGTVQLGVEQSVSNGAWTAVGAGVAPGPDGRFRTTVLAVLGASYRVTTPAGASRVVVPSVQAGVDLHLMVEHTRRHTLVSVGTMPVTKGFTATLELYSRWHFRWLAARRASLDPRGRAVFRLPASRRTFARVLLSRGRHAPALVRSDVVALRTGRAAPDPDASTAPGGGHHPGDHADGHHG